MVSEDGRAESAEDAAYAQQARHSMPDSLDVHRWRRRDSSSASAAFVSGLVEEPASLEETSSDPEVSELLESDFDPSATALEILDASVHPS